MNAGQANDGAHPPDDRRENSDTPDQFSVRVLDAGDPLVLVVFGEVDYASSPLLKAALIAAINEGNRRAVIVDLSVCGYMDSAGLGVLVEASRVARDQQRTIVLACASAQVARTFSLTRLDRLFRIADTLEDARASLAGRRDSEE